MVIALWSKLCQIHVSLGRLSGSLEPSLDV
jgi:hypothetical protein